MKHKLSLLIALSAFLAGCQTAPTPPQPIKPGSDRDEHGCIGSANMRWSEKQGRCVKWDEVNLPLTPSQPPVSDAAARSPMSGANAPVTPATK